MWNVNKPTSKQKQQAQRTDWWLPGAGSGNGELVFSEYRVSVLQDEKYSEGGWW